MCLSSERSRFFIICLDRRDHGDKPVGDQRYALLRKMMLYEVIIESVLEHETKAFKEMNCGLN